MGFWQHLSFFIFTLKQFLIFFREKKKTAGTSLGKVFELSSDPKS